MGWRYMALLREVVELGVLAASSLPRVCSNTSYLRQVLASLSLHLVSSMKSCRRRSQVS